MRTFAAVLTDSIRYLRSRFLFWLTLALSALSAVALFGVYQFTPEGVQILWFAPIENERLAAGTGGPDLLVKGLFNGFFVKFWLGWGAMILAVVSTASLLPDFLQDGAVELSLSKPISRWRLLAMKVIGAMLFVAAQVTIAVVVAWLLIGVRFHLWMPRALLAIPLLLLQFVYLYAFSTLLGVLTRSTLMALIGTLLLWFASFLVQFVSNQMDEATLSTQFVRDRLVENRDRALQAIQSVEREPSSMESFQLERMESEITRHDRTLSWLRPWRFRIRAAEFAVPKTGDLQKLLAQQTQAPVSTEFFGLLFDLNDEQIRPAGVDAKEWELAQEAGVQGERGARDVNPWASIASSLAVCGILYGVAAWRFTRRDF